MIAELPNITLADIRREREERDLMRIFDDLSLFTQYIWPEIEPGTELTWNWHLDLMAAELTALTNGGGWVRPVYCSHHTDGTPRIFDMLCEEGDEDAEWKTWTEAVFCIPPGTMKSIMVSVSWPTFKWLRNPERRGLYLANDDDLVKRDSRRCREIVESDRYQRLVDVASRRRGIPKWELSSDQNEKHNFANTRHGFRQCMSMGAKVTGKRGDEQGIDDPIDAKDAVLGSIEQIAKRMQEVVTIYDGVLGSRLNDLRTGIRAVIAQRLDARDLPGVLIARGVRHLVLPMEYDPEHPHRYPGDPRTEKGELLFPARFPQEVVDKLKATPAIARIYAAQYQQLPMANDGSVFRRKWFRYFVDRGGFYEIDQGDGTPRRVRKVDCWRIIISDTAMTKSTLSDYTVRQVWDIERATDTEGRPTPGAMFLVDQWREREEAPVVEKELRACKNRFKPMFIGVEDTPGSKLLIQRLMNDGLPIRKFKPDKDKVSRAISASLLMEAGRVYFREGGDYLDVLEPELLSFPEVDHDDQVDCVAYAGQFCADRDLWAPTTDQRYAPGTLGWIAQLDDHPEARDQKDPFR